MIKYCEQHRIHYTVCCGVCITNKHYMKKKKKPIYKRFWFYLVLWFIFCFWSGFYGIHSFILFPITSEKTNVNIYNARQQST